MNKLPKIFFGIAMICLVVAMWIKFRLMSNILPGSTPLNWAKLTDTFLLFSIALSLLMNRNK